MLFSSPELLLLKHRDIYRSKRAVVGLRRWERRYETLGTRLDSCRTEAIKQHSLFGPLLSRALKAKKKLLKGIPKVRLVNMLVNTHSKPSPLPLTPFHFMSFQRMPFHLMPGRASPRVCQAHSRLFVRSTSTNCGGCGQVLEESDRPKPSRGKICVGIRHPFIILTLKCCFGRS